MQEWILFALISPAFWAATNIIDKVVMGKYVQNPFVATTVSSLLSLPLALVLIGFNFFAINFNYVALFGILSGIIYIFGLVFYYGSLKFEEVSRVAPVLELNSLIVLVLATVFLSEVFTLNKYIGIFSLIVGSVLISIRKNLKGFELSKAFWFMFAAVLFFSISRVVAKYILGFINFWEVFFWFNIGLFITSPFLLISNYSVFSSTIKKVGKKVVGAMVFSELLNSFGILFSAIALSTGFVSLVSALGSVQPLFVLLYAILLSVLFPKLLKEELKGSIIIFKIAAISLIIFGSYLVSS